MNNTWLVYQAKSFYNAYIALEQINCSDDPLMFFVPKIVNGAFAVEVILKAILTEQGIDYDKEHNLKVLFDKLPQNLQEEFWEYLCSKKPEYTDVEKRDKELVIMSDAFIKWRYSFEDGAPAFDENFLAAFANAAIYMMFHLGYNVSSVYGGVSESCEDLDNKIETNRKKYYQKSLRYINSKEGRGQ
ncbi:MAG: HEPN domain-containing protein [Ruminiclostridium sp.]|nr:HEPN domain-containing protein [Ruminiclostridium sp.]